MRHEKEIMIENRIFRDEQYATYRQQEYDDAIARERELMKLAKSEYAEQVAMQLAQHRELLNIRNEEKHQLNVTFVSQVMNQIFDIVFNVSLVLTLGD